MKRLTNYPTQTTNQRGFTIVELLIATLVFSTVLLVITFGVIRFTNSYYKGLNSSTVQTTTQNAIDVITQSIQFSAVQSVGTDDVADAGESGYFCAGRKLFVYDTGNVYRGDPATSKGLYMMDRVGINCVPRAPANGTELLGDKMRLAYIAVENAPGGTHRVWQVSIRIAFGDADLLCNSNITGTTKGSCKAGATSYSATDSVAGQDVICKITTGSQFCSTSALSTVAQQRIVN